MSVYRWWARRTLAVNQAILRAFQADYPGGPHLVVDPFSGGGVIPLTAVSEGQRVYAQDLNPWAAAGLTTAMQLPTSDAILSGARQLHGEVEPLLQVAYSTVSADGRRAAISQTFRVSTSHCPSCSAELRHFPHAMVTLHQRKERGHPECLLACRAGHVFEGSIAARSSNCPQCDRAVDPGDSYTRGRDITCWNCATTTSLDAPETVESWRWEVVLVERVAAGGGREIGPATAEEITTADAGWSPSRDLGFITRGDETDVLLRHGFVRWTDLYPLRQRAVTEELLAAVESIDDPSVRSTLRLAMVGTTEMAGHLSRWDRWYLKSYEAMAGHRFNFTTFAVEPNVWGTSSAGRGTFQRRVMLMAKAADWLHAQKQSPLKVIGPERRPRAATTYDARVVCGSSESLDLPSDSALLCLTDPPYHDDVQYGELSTPLRAWAGVSTGHLVGDAIVNAGAGINNGIADYCDLLTRIFSEVNRTLRPEGHLVFSYANRSPDVWADVIQALDQAGFRCAGYAVLHSENETDHAKRNVRACTQDLILDMVPRSDLPIRRTIPRLSDPTDEQQFLTTVGSFLLRTGALPRGWRDRLVSTLQQSAFLS